MMVKRAIAACLTAGVMVVSVPVAGAQPAPNPQVGQVITGDVEKLNYQEIVADHEVKFTIRKPAPHPYNDVEPGQAPSELVQGFTFRLHRVDGVDVTTAEGWDIIGELKRADAQRILDGDHSDLSAHEVASAVTDSHGQALFVVKPGLYIVTEEKPAGAGENYRSAQPFFITLPVGNDDGDMWSYDVHITAKSEPSDGDTPPETTPPVTTPPVTTPPETPPTGDTPPPGEPGEPGQPGQPGDSPQRGSFASTGVNLAVTIIVGLVLLVAGMVTFYRNRRTN